MVTYMEERQNSSYRYERKFVIGANQIENIEDLESYLSIGLNTEVTNGDVVPALVNADALDDIFVFTSYDSSNINGILLLSQ